MRHFLIRRILNICTPNNLIVSINFNTDISEISWLFWKTSLNFAIVLLVN